jgi:hypothetical protein
MTRELGEADESFAPRHCPYYCEENIWWLAGDSRLAGQEPHVIFISNPARSVALWHQRAAPSPDQPVIWDYHVILLARAGSPTSSDWLAWDLDSKLSAPTPVGEYLRRTFMGGHLVSEPFRPSFRLLPATLYRREFHSDRSHMRSGEGWSQPPPPWPPILGRLEGTYSGVQDLAGRDPGGTPNLARFIDTTDAFLGELFDLEQLERWLAV